jgi:large subunit ribosomal protein L5
VAVGVSEVAVKENPMRTVKVSKVVLNMGVGRSGEMVERAKKVLTDLTGREPASKNAKQTIKEFIEIPNVKYDPAIGIFGMDASVVLERSGYRVARRRRTASRVGSKHKVTDEDAVEYFVRNLKVEVV